MRDLRQWLAEVEALGELRTLEGVHWDLEIGVISEFLGRQREKPALLFDKVPGYPPGYRVLVNTLGSRARFAATVGFPQGLSPLEMVQEWRRRSREMKLLPPRVVDTGPVMENALHGEEINVLRFPVPKWHEHDGGRYIGTGHVFITKDPDNDWINVGTYRSMVFDRNRLGVHISPTHHGALHMQKWHAQGKAMPIAMAIGTDPLLFLVGISEYAHGLSEYDWAGGIRGEPIEVIKGPITGLPLPAGSEIALEGFIEPGEEQLEGPFGEFTGYYAGGVRPKPVIRVEALYHRNEPIILGSPPLKPPEAQGYYRELIKCASLWDTLEQAGVPDVTGVWFNLVGTFFGVIAIKQRYPGHAKQAGRVGCQSYAGGAIARYMVVVDDDIDITDVDEVLWAICTRVDPEKDIEILSESLSGPLDPSIPPERKGFPTMGRVVIDATRPYEWRDRFPEVVASSPELRQQVIARWGEALKGMI